MKRLMFVLLAALMAASCKGANPTAPSPTNSPATACGPQKMSPAWWANDAGVPYYFALEPMVNVEAITYSLAGFVGDKQIQISLTDGISGFFVEIVSSGVYLYTPHHNKLPLINGTQVTVVVLTVRTGCGNTLHSRVEFRPPPES